MGFGVNLFWIFLFFSHNIVWQNMATILNCTSTPELCAQAIIQFNATIAKYKAVVSASVEGKEMYEYIRDSVELIFLFSIAEMVIFSTSIMLFHQFVIPRYKKTWDTATMQNMFVYVSNVVAGFIQLLGMASVYNKLFFTDFAKDHDRTTVIMTGSFAMITGVLCATELSFRPNMRPYLILHHIFCLLYMATMAFVARYMEDGYLHIASRACALKNLQFNTEQCVFIGLILRVYAKRTTSEETRRKLYTWSQWLMLAGIVQTVFIKLGSTVLVEVIVFRDAMLKDGFWKSQSATKAYFLYVAIEGILLSPLQLFAGYVYWQIYQGTKKTYLRDKTDPHATPEPTQAEPPSTDDIKLSQVLSQGSFTSDAQPVLTRRLSIAAMLYSAQSPIRAARSSRHLRASGCGATPEPSGNDAAEPADHAAESGNNVVEPAAEHSAITEQIP